MAGLDEFNLALGPAQRAEHPVDAVAGVTEDAPYSPLIQTFHQKVAYRAGHCLLPFCHR